MAETSLPSVLDADFACRRCGYNLRGLDPASNCPECGTAVELSIHGDLLRFADPSWIGLLIIGLWSLILSFIIAIGFRLAISFLAIMMTRLSISLSYAAFHLVAIVGAWLLTAPDSAALAESRQLTARKLVRITLVFSACNIFLRFFSSAEKLPPVVQGTLAIVAALFSLIAIVGTFATFQYIQQLARRIPNNFLATAAIALMWFYGGIAAAAAIVTISLSLAIQLIGWQVASPYFRPFFPVFTITNVATLFCDVVVIIYYVRLCGALVAQQRLARQMWSSATMRA